MKISQNGRDVITLSGLCNNPSRGVLCHLKPFDLILFDTAQDGVAVIKLRHNKCDCHCIGSLTGKTMAHFSKLVLY